MKRSMRIKTLCCLLVTLLLCSCRAAGPPEQPQEAPSREPAAASRAPASFAQAPAAPGPGEGPLTGYIGLSYEQLANAYGPSRIFHWFELGLYCHFEGVDITFYFDFAMLDPDYSDVSLWLDDPGEFIFGGGDPVYSFETGRYSPSDFKVSAIGVWGDTLALLMDELGIGAPTSLRALNKGFGQLQVAEENLMTGLSHTGLYDRGGYCYEFTFDEEGRYVASARILDGGNLDAGTRDGFTVTVWCGGLELEKEIIWLLEPTDYDGAEMGGGFAYSLTPALAKLFQAEPPLIGGLYHVKIDENSRVAQLEPAVPPPEEEVLGVLARYDETAYLMQALGMAALAEMELVVIDGKLCYTAALGTNHAGHFVRERYFAVDVAHGGLYEYDVAGGSYTSLGMG